MRGLIYFIFALGVLVRRGSNAECNVCHEANGLACYSPTQMQSCTNNLPDAVPFACPTGYVCTSTPAGVLCQVNESTVVAACNECNTCDSTQTFACTGTNSFALCLNSSTPSSIVGTCAGGLVCNIGNPFICGNLTATNTPTCSYADSPVTATTTPSTTTTVAPLPNPSTFCSNLQQKGRFPYGTDPATTCREYIVCHLLDGNWGGRLYSCPSNLYFDSSAQVCRVALPARCTAAVASLRLLDIPLI